MADLMLVGDIFDDLSGADSEDSVQESDELTDITNETESPATPKSTTSAASTVTSGLISTPSTTDSTSASSSSAASSGVNNLLSYLHRPTSSELSRKRKVDRNPPPKGKKSSRGASTSDPKSVTPSQRVKQYTGENLTVSNKKLFCLACREELSVKSSVIAYHIKSAKHISGKKKLETKRKADLEIVESL